MKTKEGIYMKNFYLDLNNKALQLAQLREELEKVKAENMALKSVKQQAFKDHLNKNNQNNFEKERLLWIIKKSDRVLSLLSFIFIIDFIDHFINFFN